jgi:hypothetical protein
VRVVVLALLLLLSACGGASTSTPAPPPPPPSTHHDDDAGASDPEVELEKTTRLVIVANQPKLRACYEDALAKTPDLEGRVVLVIDVGQNGRASHVLEGHREGLTDDVVRCLARVLKTIAFHDGAARTIRVQVPFAFSKRDE